MALLGIISSPFSQLWLALIHALFSTVPAASFLSAFLLPSPRLQLSFAIFLASSFPALVILLLILLFHFLPRLNPHMKTLPTSLSLLAQQCSNEFSLSRQGKSAFVSSAARATVRLPSPSPRVCMDVRTFARSLVRWRHNQIYSGWWVTKISKEWMLRSRAFGA